MTGRILGETKCSGKPGRSLKVWTVMIRPGTGPLWLRAKWTTGR